MDKRTVTEVTLRKGAEWNIEISQKIWWPNASKWGAHKEGEIHLELEKLQLPTFTRRRRQGVSISAYPGARQPGAQCRN